MSKLLSLRSLLLVDAATCTAMGVLLAAAAHALAGPTGLPTALLLAAGLLLLPIAAFMAAVAWRPHPVAVWLIVLGNAGWALASFVLLLSGWIAPSELGTAFVAGQGLAVIALTALEYGALRARSAACQAV